MKARTVEEAAFGGMAEGCVNVLNVLSRSFKRALAALHARLSSHGMASGSRRGIWRLSSKGVVRNKIWRKLKGIRCKRERRADDSSLQRQEQLDLTSAKDGTRLQMHLGARRRAMAQLRLARAMVNPSAACCCTQFLKFTPSSSRCHGNLFSSARGR